MPSVVIGAAGGGGDGIKSGGGGLGGDVANCLSGKSSTADIPPIPGPPFCGQAGRSKGGCSR